MIGDQMRAKGHGFDTKDRYRVEALLGQVAVEMAEAAQVVKKRFLDDRPAVALEFADTLIRMGHLADTLEIALDANFPGSAWLVHSFNDLGDVVAQGDRYDGENSWLALSKVQKLMGDLMWPANNWRSSMHQKAAPERAGYDRQFAFLFGRVCGLGRILGLDLDEAVREKVQYNGQRAHAFNLAAEFRRE